MKNRISRLDATGAAVLLISIFLASCSGPGRLPDSGPLDPATVIAAVNARNAGIHTIQAYGTVNVETPDISNSGNIQVRLSLPDSLYVDITGPFGIGVAKGLVTSSDFTLFNGLENTVMRGKTTAKNLKSVLRIAIDFRDIVSAIAGAIPIPASLPFEGKRENDSYVLSSKQGDAITEYEVGLEHAAVRRRTTKSVDGRILEELLFRDFRKRDGVYLPTVISVSRPQKTELLSLVFDRLTLNEMPLDFTFKLPKSASKIDF